VRRSRWGRCRQPPRQHRVRVFGVALDAGDPYQLRGPPAEQRKIPRPDPPTRTGQQPQQGGVAGGIVEHLQRGEHVADLRQPEQATEPDHLDRDLARGEGGMDRREVGADPGQDRDLAGCGPSARIAATWSASQSIVGVRLVQRHPNRARLLGAGRGSQCGNPGMDRAQARGQSLAAADRPAAPVLGQQVAAHRSPLAPGKCVPNSSRFATDAPRQQDRLARVADGGHR
jgi:hypothetical protein